MDRYIGKLLDNRYEIQEVIGAGGMAVVYKALCHRLNRPVAVKILKDDLSKDEEFRRRFHAESQAVAMLSHPNIVSVYDVSHTEGADYIVMELIDGISLKQYMEQKSVLNWRETLHFGTQICKALEHAHSRGIIHRDIKPHNIMILKDGSVKVADFGIAHIVSSQNTLTREAIGSVHYISPEQAKGGLVDCRADLYSLGVVLYEMLTGQTPFDGDTPVSVALQHISSTAQLPRELNPAIPEGLEQITMHAMEPDRWKRYSSATQMLQDLESFRQNPAIIFSHTQTEGAAKQKPTPREKPTAEKKTPVKKKKNRRGAIIAAVICILLAVTGLVFLFASLMNETFRQQEDAVVPDLYLMSYEDAIARYGDTFAFEKVEQAPQNNEEAGLIISQKPAAHMPVKKGAAVTVGVSTGVRTMAMPNLVNKSLDEAKRALDGFGVKIREVAENSDIYLRNYIIRTEPAYGSTLEAGQEVTLVVSFGSTVQLVPTPEMVGKNVEEALLMLEQQGLTRGSVKYVESEQPKDTVIYQSVKLGEYVRPGTAVDIEVSLGTETKVQVPVIRQQPAALTTKQFAPVDFRVKAEATDGGTLSYEWFVSYTDSTADLESVGTGELLKFTPVEAGVLNYCCKVTNTLDGNAVSTYTDIVTLTVQSTAKKVTRLLRLALPQKGGKMAAVLVKLDGTTYLPEYDVERAKGEIDIEVTAAGTHVVDIYVDGILTMSETIVFTQ